jgi:Cys-rich repeat protein
MESFKTPVGGFSNGRDQFGVFYFSKPQGCRVDADCGKGFVCDAGLGYVGERYDDDKGLTIGCVDGTPQCSADTMRGPSNESLPGSGLCTDPSSSAWAKTDAGRVSGLVVKQLIGLQHVGPAALHGHQEPADEQVREPGHAHGPRFRARARSRS